MRWKTKAQFSILGLRMVLVRFFPQGTGAITGTNVRGQGYTVARASQGLYNITFDAETVGSRFLGASLGLQLASAADRKLQLGTYTAATRVLQIRNVDNAGAVQDIAANANNAVTALCFFAYTDNDY